LNQASKTSVTHLVDDEMFGLKEEGGSSGLIGGEGRKSARASEFEKAEPVCRLVRKNRFSVIRLAGKKKKKRGVLLRRGG